MPVCYHSAVIYAIYLFSLYAIIYLDTIDYISIMLALYYLVTL